MVDVIEIQEFPQAREIFLLAGWRQWADAGSVSSGMVEYLIKHTRAHRIGKMHPEGFYLFQIPGTHDLVRPEVKFNQGYPESLNTPHNDFYYSGDENKGLVFFLGDEPHMDGERYVGAFLAAAQVLHIKRIIGFGGVYGELPYNRERMVSCIYSLREMKPELERLAVNLSNYQGGASIESYICRRAGEQGISFAAFYAFVPTYDFSNLTQSGKTLRIENDFTAWLQILTRLKSMLKLELDLDDLEKRSQHLTELLDEKITELDREEPEAGIRAYLQRLSDEYSEMPFTPSDDFWEEKLRGLFDKLDPDGETRSLL